MSEETKTNIPVAGTAAATPMKAADPSSDLKSPPPQASTEPSTSATASTPTSKPAAASTPTKVAPVAAAAAAAVGPSAEENISDVLEERLIDAEYKIWKKNTPYLYDVVMTHSLEWPSLTTQWLPIVKQPEGQPTEEHSLLLGTHTTGEQNYLMVASVLLPKSEASAVVPEDTAGSEATNNAAGSAGGESKSNSADDNGEQKKSNSTVAATPIAHYDDERNEVGGFGFTPAPTSTSNSGVTNNFSAPGKIEIRMKVKHLGEVNRARYMPQNHFIVATRGPDPELYVFDLSKHSSFPDEDSECAPQCVCVGHKKEGYGLAWSPLQEGLLLSGSEDCTVNLWDVNHIMSGNARDENNQISPKSTFVGHTDVVEDVAWHTKDANMMGSVGDDRCIMLWDIRQPKPLHVIKDAHSGDINSIAFNPLNEFLFATGSADKIVALWDMRNLKT